MSDQPVHPGAVVPTDLPDGTVLVAWTDGVPDVVWRDDNEAVLLGGPESECWWSTLKSAKLLTLEAALEGATRVEVAVPLNRSGLSVVDAGPTDSDVTTEQVDAAYRSACDYIALAEAAIAAQLTTLRGVVTELKRVAILAIAHDRQPYPTAQAYEEICAQLREVTAERDVALAKLSGDTGD